MVHSDGLINSVELSDARVALIVHSLRNRPSKNSTKLFESVGVVSYLCDIIKSVIKYLAQINPPLCLVSSQI